MSPRPPRTNRQEIVRAAIALIDADGIDSFSMRRLASAMGVDPMTLYHHLPNRAALLDAVVDELWSSIELGEPAPGTERGPLQLIDARTGIMPFADRDELRALIDWACAPQAGNGRDLALAVVTGAGGSCRTRLAVELCSALGRNGWGTGFVPDPADLGDAELTWLG